MLQKIDVQLCGVYIITVSILGLFLNSRVFLHFSKKEKSSFHMLCVSKTISNSMVLVIYLGLIGPMALSFSNFVPLIVNKYLNQAIAYGLFLQGASTQFMITLNRYLVVFSGSSMTSTPIWITVVALGASWLAALYLSTWIGFPEDCLISFSIETITWSYSTCLHTIAHYTLRALVLIAVLSNLLNVLIAVKLVTSSKSSSLSSESGRRRRRQSIRFFIQTLLQDWIYLLEMLNSTLIFIRVASELAQFFTTIGTDVLVPVADGLIMYWFNCRSSAKKIASKMSIGARTF